jgi:hypothetical protein
MTAQVQPAVQSTFTGPDQTTKQVTLPLLPDVPVVMPRGGSYAATFPITAGDECLVIFSSRNIDGWWDQGGVQPAGDTRQHDLSDGFAVMGPWSQKTKLSNISTTTAQLRSSDGTVFAEIDLPNQIARLVTTNGVSVVADGANNQVTVTAQTINLNGSEVVNLSAPTVTCSGNLNVTGEVTRGVGTGDSVNLGGHIHTINGPGPVPGS